MRLPLATCTAYSMLLICAEKLSYIRGLNLGWKRGIVSAYQTQGSRRDTSLTLSADYSGAAGRVITTPDSRWDVLAVGVVVSPYSMKYETPKQATISRHDGGAQAGSIKLFPGYEDCIDKLDGFDFIWVITYMHLNSGFKKKIKPMPRVGAVSQPPDSVGLFSSRAPHRPNPIALSALKITGVDVANGIIHVHGLDLLDGTPVLDIKPYIPAFDSFPTARAGWMDDISGDVEQSREMGYQDIVSNRGARAARAHERKAIMENMEGEKGEGEGVEGAGGVRERGVRSGKPPSVAVEGVRAKKRRERKEKKEKELELYGVNGQFPKSKRKIRENNEAIGTDLITNKTEIGGKIVVEIEIEAKSDPQIEGEKEGGSKGEKEVESLQDNSSQTESTESSKTELKIEI